MLVIVPYGVDNPMHRLPLVNWGIISANVIVFWFQAAGVIGYETYALVPAKLTVSQLLTSMFLHADFFHLFGNMLFLWTFGNNANDRLGHLRYAVAYVALGMAAGLGHVLTNYGSNIPCVGASGAVFGVIGLYLVLSPLNDVRVFYWFVISVGTFSCSGFWVIGFYVALNLLDAFLGTAGRVAVMAHLAGFGAGFGGGLLLLVKGVVPRDNYDFLSWVSRRKEKEMVARFTGGKALGPLPAPPAVHLERAPRRVSSARDIQTALLRYLTRGDVREVVDLYQRFHQSYPRLALGEELQIDVANLLFRAGQYVEAAEAYERFARYYPAHPQAPEALYSAGTLHARRTGQPEQARRLLAEAASVLADPKKAEKARQKLAELGRAASSRRVRLEGDVAQEGE
jgi:membrane associated rhomboid family serine protease